MQIQLKPFTVDHLEDFMEWATDDDVTKWLRWSSYTSVDQAKTFFHEIVDQHPWFKAICLGPKVIGSITLDKHSEYTAELGYVLAKKYWGKGYATQAIHLALQTGFEDLNIHTIEASVDPSNIASQRALEKSGFQKDGFSYSFKKPTK